MENGAECAKSAFMLDGEISKYFDILQGLAEGCTLSTNLFTDFINDLILAIETV